MRARTRQPIEARREAMLAAAIAEFAERGLHAASVEAVARAVGVSQPYVFKVYGTKLALFVACIERVFDRITAQFEAAAAGRPPSLETLHAVGDTYAAMDRASLLMLLQGFAACSDATVRAVIQRRWTGLTALSQRIGGTRGDPIQHFLGVGLLHTVGRAAELPDEALHCR